MRKLGCLVIAGAALGCTNSLAVSENAKILCESDAQCPDGWICNENTGRCVSLTDPDTEPPSLLLPVTLSPAAAKQDTIVELRFATSEPLQELEVFFGEEPARWDFVREESSEEDQPEHTLSYVVTGEEPEGAHDLSARLVDGNGNELTVALGVALTIDLTLPALDGEPNLEVIPGAGNPLSIIDSLLPGPSALTFDATSGSRIRVELATREVLDPVDSMRVAAATDSHEIPLSYVGVVIGRLIFLGEVRASTPEGDYDLEIEMQDEAGNVGSFSLEGAVTVDQTVPSDPDVVTGGMIVYNRAPWGGFAVGEGPAFWIEAAPGATEAGTLLVAASGTSGVSLAAAIATGLTTTRVDLPPFDAKEVYVYSLDLAGNVSDRVRVDDVRWLASLGTKVAGSSVENPNQFFASHVSSSYLQPLGADEAGALEGLAEATCYATCDPSRMVTTPGLGYWVPLAPTWPFLPKYGVAVGYDYGRDVVVAFGGRDSLYRSQADFWEWDGTAWDDPYIVGAFPENRHGAALAYDNNLEALVLFGGYQVGAPVECTPKAVGACGDAWSWDGTDWVELAVVGGPPAPRAEPALAFDYGRGQLILFGGNQATTEFDDTWALDCSSLPCSWNNIFSGSLQTPAARTAAGLVWDGDGQQLVLYGGKGDYDALLSDVWVLTKTGWVERTGDAGIARYNHSLVYDPTRYEILSWGVDILFGNRDVQTTCGRPWRVSATELSCPANAAPFGIRDLPETALAHALYIPAMKGTLIIGPEYGTDAYLWQGAAGGRPLHVFHAAFGLAVGGGGGILVDRVNFQPAEAQAPFGYLVQGTAAFSTHSDGRSYGWTCNNLCPSSEPEAFDDNASSSLDQRYDTYVQMRYGPQADPEYDCAWEYALDNGTYRVHLVAGSPRAEDLRRHVITVEGTVAIDETPSPGYPWIERGVDVQVTDGRLTLASGAANSRIAFVEIVRPTLIRSIEVNWVAGGTGVVAEDSDTGQNGVNLYAFDGNEWTLLMSGNHSASAPGLLSWTSSSAVEASSLLTGQSRILGLSAASRGVNGRLPNGATLTSDYVQAVVHYRVSEVQP